MCVCVHVCVGVCVCACVRVCVCVYHSEIREGWIRKTSWCKCHDGRWVLIWRSHGKKKKAAAAVQLDSSVLIWHVVEWFLTAPVVYSLYAVRSKK